MANSRIVNTPAQALAQDGTTHQQFTVAAVAGTLETLGSFTFNARTTHVLIQFSGSCRMRMDGTAPTTAIGFLYADGKEAYWPIALASKVQLISAAGTATIELQELNYR